jgi:hypothetical protein
MNLDDLMAVWRSQDASPLHGVNETLLRLALRQDEAKLQRHRRLESRIVYVMSALFTGIAAVLVVLMFAMLFYNADDAIVGWDLAVPLVGAAAAVFMGAYLYVTHRGRALREQRFGDSLRDQLSRRIAQLDDEATRSIRTMTVCLVSIFAFATAIHFAFTRINLELNEPFGLWDDWPRLVRRILVFAIIWALCRWAVRRAAKRDLVSRKARLEALLKEIEVP